MSAELMTFSTARYPWRPDCGDGRFCNPVLHADYSDPDVIRHGEDFYLVSSSFTATPGLPILHSRDLVNWRIINHAIRQVPHPRYTEVRPGCGVWAPAIRFHGGKFWIFFPLPDEGIYVTCADNPADEWSEPWCLQEAKGWIDPCPFWDDDGQAYLFHAYANSRAGKKERIHCRPMSADCTRLLGEGNELFHTPHHLYLEGPKVHKLNGYYYILAPGGGVPTGWQVVFRSRNLWGPYEEKVVLERGATPINGPHQGALVDLENGEWWFLHFQDVGPFGRIVHLQPVRWEDDWPVIGVDHDGNGISEPVAGWRKPGINAVVTENVTPQTDDEFDSPTLGLQWQWQANHARNWWSLEARRDWLRLFAQTRADRDLGLTPSLLMQKFPARSFCVETCLDFSAGQCGDEAGLAITGGGAHVSLTLEWTESGPVLCYQINGERLSQRPLLALTRLRVTVDENATCRFAYAAGADGDSFTEVGPALQAKEGGWMGAKVGLYCLHRPRVSQTSAGHADFDYFRFSPQPPTPRS